MVMSIAHPEVALLAFCQSHLYEYNKISLTGGSTYHDTIKQIELYKKGKIVVTMASNNHNFDSRT